MIPLVALVAWAGCGALAAYVLSPSPQRWGWMPMAVFMGPFWAAIAAEQQEAFATSAHVVTVGDVDLFASRGPDGSGAGRSEGLVGGARA